VIPKPSRARNCPANVMSVFAAILGLVTHFSIGRSGEVAKATPEKLGVDLFELHFNIPMGTLPDRYR
jgi:hypothetical protein